MERDDDRREEAGLGLRRTESAVVVAAIFDSASARHNALSFDLQMIRSAMFDVLDLLALPLLPMSQDPGPV
jgi:hypothetical protein